MNKTFKSFISVLFASLILVSCGKEQPEVYKAEKSECDGRPFSFAYDLPAYGVAVFKF